MYTLYALDFKSKLVPHKKMNILVLFGETFLLHRRLKLKMNATISNSQMHLLQKHGQFESKFFFIFPYSYVSFDADSEYAN
jgi:hypothetical protein